MFYHLSKIAWFVMEPTNALLLLIIAGLLLIALRFVRVGLRVAGTGAIIALLLGFTPAANWLIVPLETRFPVPDLTGKKIDGIIALGGALQERQTLAHGPVALNDAGERVVVLAELARRFPDARIVFSGGAGFYSTAPEPEAKVLADRADALGLPRGRLLIEPLSRNTHENALFSRAIAQPRPGETWLLVTSAWHMPRSVGIFRHVGWEVLPYPVDFRTGGWDDLWRGFASASDGLRRSDLAMREWIGLLVYRLTGRSDALFPAPTGR